MDNDSIAYSNKNFFEFNRSFNKNIKSYNCLIISDYDKGACESRLLQYLINSANKNNLPIFIDPKGKDWDKYSSSTCITPNSKEVEDILNIRIKDDEGYVSAGKKIIKNYNIKSILITRGAEGMTFVDNTKVVHQKVGEKEVFDVSGAGDTAISAFATCYAMGYQIKESLKFAVSLSSEVVSHFGTTPFNVKMLK